MVTQASLSNTFKGMVRFMHIVEGKSVSGGKGIGRLVFINGNHYNISKTKINNVEQELERFQKARADALNQLQSIYERALNKVSESNAKIFVIQQMMIHDQSFTQAIKDLIISHGVSAKYAVSAIASRHISLLKSTNDEYMQARTTDVIDLSSRVIRNLSNQSDINFFKEKNTVLYKYILTPSEIIELDINFISAAISFHGNRYSHSAILARAMNIPGITDINEDIRRFSGKKVEVDADIGKIFIET